MNISQGIHGIAYGMILFLIASGLNIIFGMMGILNMALSLASRVYLMSKACVGCEIAAEELKVNHDVRAKYLEV